MGSRSFALVADVSSADSAAIEPVLRGLIDGEINDRERLPCGGDAQTCSDPAYAHVDDAALRSRLRD